MKTIRMIGLAWVACTLFAATTAEAHGYGGWGRHQGYNWGARAFVGIPGPMLYYSPYTYTYNPYPTTVVIQQSTQPVQAPAPVIPQPPPVQHWYFCESANGYYPSVPSCEEGWKMIPVTPSAR